MAGAAGIVVGNDLVRLRFELEGFDPVMVGLTGAVTKARDFRPFWRTVVAPWFFGLVQEQFASEGKAVGGWAPLSPRYAAWKATRYPGKTILRRTDRLMRSLTWTGATLATPEGIAVMGPTDATFGTSVPYARFHQRGTRTMRQRRILYLPSTPDPRDTLGRMLERWAREWFGGTVRAVSMPTAVSAGPGGRGTI